MRVTFSFNREAGATYRCKLDSAAYSSCAPPRSYWVKLGGHIFSVKATDAAGNTGTARYSFKVTKKRRHHTSRR